MRSFFFFFLKYLSIGEGGDYDKKNCGYLSRQILSSLEKRHMRKRKDCNYQWDMRGKTRNDHPQRGRIISSRLDGQNYGSVVQFRL